MTDFEIAEELYPQLIKLKRKFPKRFGKLLIKKEIIPLYVYSSNLNYIAEASKLSGLTAFFAKKIKPTAVFCLKVNERIFTLGKLTGLQQEAVLCHELLHFIKEPVIHDGEILTDKEGNVVYNYSIKPHDIEEHWFVFKHYKIHKDRILSLLLEKENIKV